MLTFMLCGWLCPLPGAARSIVIVFAVALLLNTHPLHQPQTAAQDAATVARPDCQLVHFPLTPRAGDAAASARYLAEAVDAANRDESHLAYRLLWQAHAADPAELAVRRILGLPLRETLATKFRPARGAPPVLRWRQRTYLQLESPHFVIFSQADRQSTLEIAGQLERFYWVWTQVFFPLWEARNRVDSAIQSQASIGTAESRHQVVLFADSSRYIDALRRHVPGVERSTGYYADAQQCTFLFAGPDSDPATWYHELTHQLLRQATDSRLDSRAMPGENADFWLVEGIAAYMESTRFASDYGLVGGWESPRLQYARYRWLGAGDKLRLEELRQDGLATAQRRNDLPRWYAHAAAYAHLLMDSGFAGGRPAIFAELARLYRFPDLNPHTGKKIDTADASKRMFDFLNLNDEQLFAPEADLPLRQLCLGRTRVTPEGLSRIPAQSELRWLDLSFLEVTSQDVVRLVGSPQQLDQLNLERTRITDALAPWLQGAQNLTEVDFSLTRIGDVSLAAIPPTAPLTTVYLTGTEVTAAAINDLGQIGTLQQIDLQRTLVDAQELAHLEKKFPHIEFNPLQVISQE